MNHLQFIPLLIYIFLKFKIILRNMDVPSQIYQLQKLSFPHDTPESVMQKYQFFFIRILSSRVSQSVYDDDSLQTEMTRIQTVFLIT